MCAIHLDQKAVESALKLAKTPYQRSLINGTQRLSGSDLKGKARRYAGNYAKSRDNLLKRMRENEINFDIKIIQKRLTLIIG